MTQPKPISRLFSLFLTGVLLFLAAGGSSWVTAAPVTKQLVSAKEAADKKAGAKSETVVKAASLEAVVTPATSFDFGQTVFLLPPPSVLIISIEQPALPRPADIPYYFFSYFRHVFGNHIATNAP